MKKQRLEEDLDLISGWQNREDNESQRGVNIKQLKQEMDVLCKKTLLPLSKIRFREHQRTKTKESYQYEKSDLNNLKRDKQLLQRHFLKENQLKLQSCRISNQQEYLPLKQLHLQTQITHSKLERRLNNRSIEEQVRKFASPQQPSNRLEKYTLFSGMTFEINKRRKYLLRISSKQNFQRSKLKTDVVTNALALRASKCNFNRIGKMKEINESQNQVQKRRTKFPLYYRELTSKQRKIRKCKHSSTQNLHQQNKYKNSIEFQDDNIFSSKHIEQ